MSDADQARVKLIAELREVLSPESAGYLMEQLPPTPWDKIATKDDLENQGRALRSEMADLRADLRSEMADLRADMRSEMAELRGDMRAEIADLRIDLKTEVSDLRSEMHSEMSKLGRDLSREINLNLRIMVAAQLGTFGVLFSLIASKL